MGSCDWLVIWDLFFKAILQSILNHLPEKEKEKKVDERKISEPYDKNYVALNFQERYKENVLSTLEVARRSI